MVIHHPGGLHMGIDNCWPNKMRSILMMVVVILALGFTPASYGPDKCLYTGNFRFHGRADDSQSHFECQITPIN
jgi:hypothetical protein